MPNTKVSDLTAAGALDGTELYYGVQGGADRKVTGAQIQTLVGAVRLTSPTISAPVTSIVFQLPTGYLYYQATVVGLKTSVSADLLFEASTDGGSTWLGDNGTPFYSSGLTTDSPISKAIWEYAWVSSNPVTLPGIWAELTVTPGNFDCARWHAHSIAEYPGLANDAHQGAIIVQYKSTSSTLASGGTGYTAGNVLTIADGSNNGRVTVDTVDGSGVILTYHISTAAYDQIGGNTNPISLTGGSGSGATLNVTYTQQVVYPINAFRIRASAGNLTAGQTRLYGFV